MNQTSFVNTRIREKYLRNFCNRLLEYPTPYSRDLGRANKLSDSEEIKSFMKIKRSYSSDWNWNRF
jgi:hypothetical protein